MEQLLYIAYSLLVAGIISLLALQFSPSKHTITKASQNIVKKNLRPTLWGLPFHMLTTYGKTLKATSVFLLCFGLLLLTSGYLYE